MQLRAELGRLAGRRQLKMPHGGLLVAQRVRGPSTHRIKLGKVHACIERDIREIDHLFMVARQQRGPDGQAHRALERPLRPHASQRVGIKQAGARRFFRPRRASALLPARGRLLPPTTTTAHCSHARISSCSLFTNPHDTANAARPPCSLATTPP